MPLAVEFHPEARDDFDHAIDWYNRERPDLGARFVRAVEASVRRAGRCAWTRIAHGERTSPRIRRSVSLLGCLLGGTHSTLHRRRSALPETSRLLEAPPLIVRTAIGRHNIALLLTSAGLSVAFALRTRLMGALAAECWR